MKKIKCVWIWCLLGYKYYSPINNNQKSETSTQHKYLIQIIQPKYITYPINTQDNIKTIEQLNVIKIIFFERTGDYIHIKNEKDNMCMHMVFISV